MTDIWIWTVWTEDGPTGASAVQLGPEDLVGYAVEARDGHIGDVDAATSEADGAGFVVVDTGFWIFAKRRMVPAGLVERVDPGKRKVYLACTKAQVKDGPDYDEARSNDRDHRDDIGRYFESSQYRGMEGDPVGPTPGTAHVDPHREPA